MKKTLLIIIILTIDISACTTFVIKDSINLLFCRNYDYDLGSGFVVVNKRGTIKQAIVFTQHQPLKWISKYGSITFNQIGIDSPMGGMNEKGLVISQMALLESRYPEYKSGPVLNQLEWIQYQLDNSLSLEEVIENSKKLHVIPVSTPVHYFVCDSSGNIGIFEYLNGELIIHKGVEITIPVCSNMVYEQSKSALKKYKLYGGHKNIPTSWKTVSDIIVIANSKIIEYQNSNENNPIEYGFEILNAVGSSERTQWSIVYDIKNMNIYFKSLSNNDIRKISFNKFNYDCDNSIKILEIQTSNNSIPLRSQFFNITRDYYKNYKENLIHWFKTNIEGFQAIPNDVIKYEVDYVFQRKCK